MKKPNTDPRISAWDLAVGFKRTPYGNAERLVAAFGHLIRYCPPKKSWYVWDGKCWAPDRGAGVQRLAKRTLRLLDHAVGEVADDKERASLRAFITRSESSSNLDAMVKIASSEIQVVVLPEHLDRHPWVLNLLNGTLDLKTGKLRAHKQEDLLTKLAPVEFNPTATDERWVKFLAEATGGDADLEAMLARAVFASLVGEQYDKAFMFLLGPPDSGKTTFINAVAATLGPYAGTLGSESLLKRSLVGGIRSDIASLDGKRFVSSVEIEQGRQMAAGLVKLLTGGEHSIQVEYKYENAFEIRPQFTLWLAANDVPKVNAEDEAMWNRFRVIPFRHRAAKVDPSLKDYLQRSASARSAVLAWAMRQRSQWLADGIGAATVVEEATAAVRHGMDPIAGWLEDECVLEAGAWTPAEELWSSYGTWCLLNGENHISQKNFGLLLRGRGLEPKRRRVSGEGRRGWDGIRLS